MQHTGPDGDSQPLRLVLPRHREAAVRAVAYFMVVAGAVMFLSCAVAPGYAGNTVTSLGVTLAVAALVTATGTFCWRRPDRVPDSLLVGSPVAAVLIIAALDLLTRDTTRAAQLYFVWPVLFAATYLRRRAILAVLGLAVAADAGVALTLLPTGQVTSDIISMITVLAMATVIIVKLREKADDLVTALEQQALTDPLTGLANRRAFARDAELAVARAKRAGTPLCLMTVDVDRFKQFNDVGGHAAGDAALQAVADALRCAVRACDIVARLGGDEFAALLETGPDGGWRVARQLRQAVARAAQLPGPPPTLSIGLACLPADADSMETLLAASDAALYRAKAAGRDRIIAGRPEPTDDATVIPGRLGVTDGRRGASSAR